MDILKGKQREKVKVRYGFFVSMTRNLYWKDHLFRTSMKICGYGKGQETQAFLVRISKALKIPEELQLEIRGIDSH